MASERGRPRAFDIDEALDRALAVFWSHGFQGASLSQLTAAMEVSKPSLYAAFGDKETLYLKALERYAQRQIAHRASILDTEPNGRRAVECYLRSVASMLTNPSLPGGCLVVNGATDCGDPAIPAAVESALCNALRGSEAEIAARLKRAQHDGQLAVDVKVKELAAFFITLVAGLGVLAKSGAKHAKLDAVISTAMETWSH